MLPQLTIFQFLSAWTLTSAVSALPAASKVRIASIEKRQQDCAATCANVCYQQSDLDDAVSNGYGLYQNGQQEGKNKYPHAFNNYEGFNLLVDGPYQEFPVLNSYQPYSGGSPGADRVVFNTNGDFAGSVTHTGASGNNFVACT